MPKLSDEHFMRLAIGKAKQGIKKGQAPFGACVVKDGRVLSCRHNTVWRSTDVTAHAEIKAIKEACRRLNRIDLSGCVIYSTCEPCPMCYSAIHWARIPRIFYGAGIRDAVNAGFHELQISDCRMRQLGRDRVKIKGGLLKEECLGLFHTWLGKKRRRAY